MGDLRDQLKKAKLISNKDAKRLAHEERLERSRLGGNQGVEKAREDRAQELQRLQSDRRTADRENEATRRQRIEENAERAACAELVRRESFRPKRGGATRWFFQLQDGRLPWMEVPAVDRLRLAEGALCVVRVGPADTHDYALIDASHARRIAAVLPETVVWPVVKSD
ncbi:MAG: DUF2058 family protein [Planctomycetes bacterium]|nr:DUF2058 family protein [Planctomycetota bacterium]MCB9871855.1 DUF2058 family protein [Planctomycetota bacterium]